MDRLEGSYADKPKAGVEGRTYVVTEGNEALGRLYFDTGRRWRRIRALVTLPPQHESRPPAGAGRGDYHEDEWEQIKPDRDRNGKPLNRDPNGNRTLDDVRRGLELQRVIESNPTTAYLVVKVPDVPLAARLIPLNGGLHYREFPLNTDVHELIAEADKNGVRPAPKKAKRDAEREAAELRRRTRDIVLGPHAQKSDDLPAAKAALARQTGMTIRQIRRLQTKGKPSTAILQKRKTLDKAFAVLLDRFTRDVLGEAAGIAGRRVEDRAKRQGWTRRGSHGPTLRCEATSGRIPEAF